MNRPVGITKKNVYAFLRSFAKDIDTDDLEMLPHRGINIVFYYRDDRILKVAKSENARLSLLKEAGRWNRSKELQKRTFLKRILLRGPIYGEYSHILVHILQDLGSCLQASTRSWR